jgi:hypothetical protein
MCVNRAGSENEPAIGKRPHYKLSPLRIVVNSTVRNTLAVVPKIVQQIVGLLASESTGPRTGPVAEVTVGKHAHRFFLWEKFFPR